MLRSQGRLSILIFVCVVTADAIKLQVGEGVEYECVTKSKSPKLTLVTVVAGLSADYVSALRTNRVLEADAYGYEYCEFRSRQDPIRHPNWEKVKALQYLLAQGRQRLVWMDADAFFTKKMAFENITYNGEAVFSKLGQDVDIIFTDDMGRVKDPMKQCNINLGVMAMVNSDWTQTLWHGVWSYGKPAAEEPGNHDQPALCKWKWYNMDGFKAHSMTIPHHLMNNVRLMTGEFVAHVAGGGGALNGQKYEELEPYVGDANSAMGRRVAEILPQLLEANAVMAAS